MKHLTNPCKKCIVQVCCNQICDEYTKHASTVKKLKQIAASIYSPFLIILIPVLLLILGILYAVGIICAVINGIMEEISHEDIGPL